MCEIIIVYTLLIVGVALLFGVNFSKVKNKSLRIGLKLISSCLSISATVYAFYAIDFPLVLAVLIEAICVGLFVMGLMKGLYAYLVDEFRLKFIQEHEGKQILWDYFAHVIVSLFLMTIVALSILIPIDTGKIIAPFTQAVLLTGFFTVLITFVFYVGWMLVKLLWMWIKWIFR